MLVGYAVAKMGCFDDDLDADPRAKTMKLNGINTLLLHVSDCITFQYFFITATIISETSFKSFYS